VIGNYNHLSSKVVLRLAFHITIKPCNIINGAGFHWSSKASFLLVTREARKIGSVPLQYFFHDILAATKERRTLAMPITQDRAIVCLG
jgi:hypothetical protein